MNTNLGKNIERRRLQLGKTQAQVAEAAGMSTTMLHKLITGKAKSTGRLVGLAKALECTSEELVSGNFKENSNVEQVFRELSKVPVISWVNAGKWCDSPDNYPPSEAEEWVESPFKHSDTAFCLRVVGDSMSPEYREDEYILVDPEVEARHNDDVVARTPDGNYTFKRLQITPEGTYLLALNPDHPERKIKVPKYTHICGVVTGSWIRRRKTH